MVYSFYSKTKNDITNSVKCPSALIIAIFGVYFKTENSSGFPSPVFGNDKTVKDVSFTPPYWDKVLMHSVLKAGGCSQGADIARASSRISLSPEGWFGGVTCRLNETVRILDQFRRMVIWLQAYWILVTEIWTINISVSEECHGTKWTIDIIGCRSKYIYFWLTSVRADHAYIPILRSASIILMSPTNYCKQR